MSGGAQGSLFGMPEAPEPKKIPAAKKPVDLPPVPIALLRGRAANCRSCGRPVVFAITIKTVRGEEKLSTMPVDVEPDADGNVRLTMSGRNVRAYVINKADRAGRQSLHRSHMATCPKADEWRGRGRGQR